MSDPCPTCHGYGTADGEPAGTLPRDTYDDPGPCARCGGSGLYTPRHNQLLTYPTVLSDGEIEWRTEGVTDGPAWLEALDVPNCRCIALPFPLCELCDGTGSVRGCARHGGQCDGADNGCTDSYPCPCGAGEVEP